MDIFADNLRRRARELGLSDAEVARRAGLTERRYGHYVTGGREPDLATLVKIAEALAVTPNDLLYPFGGDAAPTERKRLLNRLSASAATLGDGDVALAVDLVEAVMARRRT